MDPGEIVEDRNEISTDHNESSVDPTVSGARGGDSRDEHSPGTGEKQHDDSDDTSGSEQQQDGGEIHGGSLACFNVTRSGVVIESIDELRRAIKRGKLSEVKRIDLNQQDIGSGHLTLAEALASGQMSALEVLKLWQTGLEDDRSEAIGNALTSGKFPSLTRIIFGFNWIRTKGIEALGRAIQSGSLKRLEKLDLERTGVDDTDMATLATAFQHGDEASVVPNLVSLNLRGNYFTEVGLQSLAQALQSGKLDSLKILIVDSSLNPSQGGADALVSALALNNRLAVRVNFEWHMFPDLHRRQTQLRNQNIVQNVILAELIGCPMVPAAFGKVYLCGSPNVGKTTLSNTFRRRFSEALFSWQRKPHVEKRTRGIDVSQFSSKRTTQNKNPITLLVWDMAGQQDYHLVHNAFFPDLSSSKGKATTFVIVCNSTNLDEAKQQLVYWLRYIASSCHKTTRRLRHVFAVLNNIGGNKRVQGYAPDWKMLLEQQRDKFKGLLNLHTNPFVMDVRRRRQVSDLKRCLLQQSQNLLNDEMVPEICQNIQRNLPTWSKGKKDFPVLDWEEYVQEVHRTIAPWPEKIIEATTKYLNEAGVLIHIDKTFPSQWGIPYTRLVVLDVNWFCKEIVGNIFLSEDMVNQRERLFLFRKRVDETTGSISISEFKKFFKSDWSEKDFENLIAILLWLGLCYKGNEENVFIPSLIDKNAKPRDLWQSQRTYEDGEDQWVMGFSIEHMESERTLAPMSLWHRFQVQLGQTSRFTTELLDNDFVAGKYFMTFTVDYMAVLIEADATEDIPTFHEVSIFVKPKLRKDDLDAHERKQRQVDLANDLVDVLLGLWDDICGGVQYVRKVVWPWPSSQSKPDYILDRNVEVGKLKKLVQMHGMGRKMHWTVGHHSLITEDQLLSTKDKTNVIQSAKNEVNVLRQGMQQAVSLRIYPPELIEDSGATVDGKKSVIPPTILVDEKLSMEGVTSGQDGIDYRVTPHTTPTHKKLHISSTDTWLDLDKKLDMIINNQDKILKEVMKVENMLMEGFAMVLNEQRKVLRKLQDTERFFKEDKDRTCPTLIYLGEKDSGVWATLKQALSPSVYVRLRFACEAKYNDYRPHLVTGQQGLDVSAWRPSLKKIAPWLKVSLTILLISAKIGANFVAPGLGLIFPNFQQWQQASSLLEGIEWATGFPKAELDQVVIEGMGLDVDHAIWDPRVVYGKSREAITNLIGDLTTEEYEHNFGLRKVCLRYSDGSLHGVVWICTECLRSFHESHLVSDL
ncbi:unnamed protein product [Calypogeia fissa]